MPNTSAWSEGHDSLNMLQREDLGQQYPAHIIMICSNAVIITALVRPLTQIYPVNEMTPDQRQQHIDLEKLPRLIAIVLHTKAACGHHAEWH